MSLSLISTPLRTLVFALAGAGLAWLWYNAARWTPLAAVIAVWVGAWAVQHYGLRRLPRDPETAVTWLECRVLAVAAATAALAAGAIIVAVEIAAPSSAEPAAKEIVTTVATALVAFVTSVAIKEDDVDSAIGDFIKDRFEAAYPVANVDSPVQEGKTITLPLDSAGTTALYRLCLRIGTGSRTGHLQACAPRKNCGPRWGQPERRSPGCGDKSGPFWPDTACATAREVFCTPPWIHPELWIPRASRLKRS